MNTFLNKQRVWMLPAVLILFILEVITFPFVISFTWADRSENPKNVLTYTRGKLTWNNAENIDANGVAELSMFDTVYENVKSDDKDKVVAPGTNGKSIVRLKNSVSNSINYTAVLYSTKSVDELPVEASLSGDNYADTEKYVLPEGVNKSDVIRAVSGTLGGGLIQDFDISWNWDYENSEVQDEIDTFLGNKAADDNADDVTVGMYIIVEDENYINPDAGDDGNDDMNNNDDGNKNEDLNIDTDDDGIPDVNVVTDPGKIVKPKSPSTGTDDIWSRYGSTGVGIYIALMCISAFILILLILEKRRNKKCEE